MNIRYKTEEEKEKIIKFLNYYLMEFLRYAENNPKNLSISVKFCLEDNSKVCLAYREIRRFTEKWIDRESEIIKDILDKSEEREQE